MDLDQDDYVLKWHGLENIVKEKVKCITLSFLNITIQRKYHAGYR